MNLRVKELTDKEIDSITSEWNKLPRDIKDKYQYIYFSLVDQRKINEKSFYMLIDVIKKHNPEAFKQEEQNIQYVDYNEGQFKYMDQLYSMNKKDSFISKLINQAKKNGRLTKAQDYFLMFYLKKGQTPYSAKLLPNNY